MPSLQPRYHSYGFGWSEAAPVPIVHLAVKCIKRAGEVSAGIILGGRVRA